MRREDTWWITHYSVKANLSHLLRLSTVVGRHVESAGSWKLMIDITVFLGVFIFKTCIHRVKGLRIYFEMGVISE